jgi:hypothetical protein
MAFPLTAAQKTAFLGNHEMSTRATVFRGGQSLGDIPLMDMEVHATYGTRGGRDATLVVDHGVVADGLLNPLSDQVILYTGIKNFVEVPIFTGRVATRNAEDASEVTVPLMSRGVSIIEAQFEVPWPVTVPYLSTSEIMKIIQDVDPTWAVDTSRATARAIPTNLVFEWDRGQALDQIAQGASQVWQPDRTGGFVLYDNPYSIGPALASESVVTLTDGEGGVTARVLDAITREGVYNSVTVVVERVNNTEPIRVTARDTDPLSPTLWGGVFGKQNKVVKNQNPTNISDASLLALRILRQSLALQRSWRIEVPHLPFLDPGDVFTLWYQNEVTAQVVESIAYSGTAEQRTVISSRELTLSEPEVTFS